MGEERERGREEGVITGQNGGVLCVKSFFFFGLAGGLSEMLMLIDGLDR